MEIYIYMYICMEIWRSEGSARVLCSSSSFVALRLHHVREWIANNLKAEYPESLHADCFSKGFTLLFLGARWARRPHCGDLLKPSPCWRCRTLWPLWFCWPTPIRSCQLTMWPQQPALSKVHWRLGGIKMRSCLRNAHCLRQEKKRNKSSKEWILFNPLILV